MKKLIAILLCGAVLIGASAFALHYLGDNVYSMFVFTKNDVIEVEDNVYHCPKDNPDAFIDYMKDNGWILNENEQMGAMLVFEKGNKRATAIQSFELLYTEYDVEYIE